MMKNVRISQGGKREDIVIDDWEYERIKILAKEKMITFSAAYVHYKERK